ncbi:hypothetical protein KFE25_011969 [Diacronema lutheri]|uniref:Uncharacterized protein n=1 Tax=Diacronema lutheri TaxID=2081491 RepID=A0A8J5X7J9_DIALT|nr:hypothetical protein KFE25_011969 [Diacronema lutheri]
MAVVGLARTAALTVAACLVGLLIGRAGVGAPQSALEARSPVSPVGVARRGQIPRGAASGEQIPLSQLELLEEDVVERPVALPATSREAFGFAPTAARARRAVKRGRARNGSLGARMWAAELGDEPGSASRVEHPSGGFPSLLVLGTSKGGSTFLFDCLASALHPRAVCGSESAADWLGPSCAGRGRRFVLPALRVHVQTHQLSVDRPRVSRIVTNIIKENYAIVQAMYHGPKAASHRQAYYRGPQLPLELWELAAGHRGRHAGAGGEAQRAHSLVRALLDACAEHAGNGHDGCPVMARNGAVHAWRTADRRMGEACGVRAPMVGHGPGGGPYASPPLEALVGARCGGGAAGARGVGARGGSGGMNVSRLLAPLSFLADVRAFPTLPREMADPESPDLARGGGRSPIVGLDACPYYLAEPTAAMLLSAIAPPSVPLRLVVLLRAPVARAYSEWSMASSWKGRHHRSHSFEKAASEQLRQLERCVRASGGLALSGLVGGGCTERTFRQVEKDCIKNDYYRYVSNSLYGVHLRNWLATFDPSSFLLLETEAMKAMAASDLLHLVASHAGVSLPLALPPSLLARCEARSMGGALPNHKTRDVPLDAEVEWRLRGIYFPTGTERLWALNMVLPPQLARRSGDESVGAREYACSRVRCAPAGPSTPTPWERARGAPPPARTREVSDPARGDAREPQSGRRGQSGGGGEGGSGHDASGTKSVRRVLRANARDGRARGDGARRARRGLPRRRLERREAAAPDERHGPAALARDVRMGPLPG